MERKLAYSSLKTLQAVVTPCKLRDGQKESGRLNRLCLSFSRQVHHFPVVHLETNQVFLSCSFEVTV